MSRKIIIAANRLPYQVDKDKKLKLASGGLVTALSSLSQRVECLWIGYAPKDHLEKLESEITNNVSPLTFEDTLYQKYYNDFSNGVLWPLFHYMNPSQFTLESWQAYKDVNKKFAEHISKIAHSDDMIWIHDYHLCLTPRYLREMRPELKIGFFLHIPFPSSEVFRELPCRTELLDGLLACDIVGFQEFSHLRHFATSSQSVLETNYNLLSVEYKNFKTRLGVFPVSIDTQKHLKALKKPSVTQEAQRIESSRQKIKQILGIDRLDYTKGLDLKLLAFRRLLEKYPEMKGKVQLFQLAIPTREKIPEYQETKQKVEQLIGQINGEFGTPTYNPIKYMYGTVEFDQLVAMYNKSELLVVSSIRDGMNLVIKEYIVSQSDESPGAALLSEFAGASSSLPFVDTINPWNIEETADKIYAKLQQPSKDRREYHSWILEYLVKYNSKTWAESFIKSLSRYTGKSSQISSVQQSTQLITHNFSEKLGGLRLLIIDYDGTLVPIVDSPEKALLPKETLALLTKIKKRSYLAVLSGRPMSFISEQVSLPDVFLGAEHGAEVKYNEHYEAVSDIKKTQWYSFAYEYMEEFCNLVPNSFIEEKKMSLVWHYRTSPPRYSDHQAARLSMDLREELANYPVHVVRGKKVVEVKSAEANKGNFLRKLFRLKPELKNATVIAIGDDRTDEDLFRSLRAQDISIKVGKGPTYAKYRAQSVGEVHEFLQTLT